LDQAIVRRTGVRQFLKFCIVGASSTLIDFGIYLTLIEGCHLDRRLGIALALARTLSQTISFGCAVSWGFYWNNRWTFDSAARAGHGGRYARFVLTNIIGLGLNLTILNATALLIPSPVADLLGHLLRDPRGFVGKAVATVVVAFWNFSASKYWTFRK
jgi:putative flippase GtrA